MRFSRIRGAFLAPFVLVCAGVSGADVFVTAEGGLTADIVLPAKPTDIERFAAEELGYHLGKAFGVSPDVVGETALTAGVRTCHFYVGRTKAAASAGLLDRPLEDEERRLKSVVDGLCLVGGDRDMPYGEIETLYRAKSCGTLFAVYDFLERELGVLWLWPGELGEVIPKRTELSLVGIDRSGREPLIKRSCAIVHHAKKYGFSTEAARRNYNRAERRFLLRHRMGIRNAFEGEHSFCDWWQRFHETHPEYFNLLPNGKREPLQNPRTVSMCVSCPGLWSQKVEDWWKRYEADRKRDPSVLPWVCCCDNDCAGTCTCDACRAWDGPDPRFGRNAYWNGELKAACAKAGADAKLGKIGHAEFGTLSDTRWYVSKTHPTNKCPASVSDRYARFYNAVLQEARRRNPAARVAGYAYVNYLEGPLEAKVDPGVVIIFVPRSYYPYDQEESDFFRKHWMGWRNAGVKDFIYRPNYTYAGGNYPMDNARRELDDFAFAATNGMIGCSFDALVGSWSAHAMSSYAFCRTMREPTRGYERARADMLSAFGAAAADVNRYFDAVEAHSRKWTQDAYREIALKNPNPTGFWTGGSFATPAAVLEEYFSDADLRRYHAILDEAVRSAKGDPMAVARVGFLRKGIRDAELTRNCRIAQKRHLADKGDAAKKAAFESALRELDAYRTSVEGDFVCNYAHHAAWEKEILLWPHEETPSEKEGSSK